MCKFQYNRNSVRLSSILNLNYYFFLLVLKNAFDAFDQEKNGYIEAVSENDRLNLIEQEF